MKQENKTKQKQINAKMNLKYEEFLKGHPRCFIEYMNYVRSLEFDQKPDYKFIRYIFEEAQK